MFNIRWGLRRDVPAYLACETGWTDEDFHAVLDRRDHVAMSIENGDSVFGVFAYKLLPYSLELLNIGVHPNFRRMHLASAMLDKLKYKCAQHGRVYVGATAPADNLALHLLLRAHDFRAVKCRGDEYRFVHTVPALDEREFVLPDAAVAE